MAATPMAMPSADSPARSLRVRSPTVERRARSDGAEPVDGEGPAGGHGRPSSWSDGSPGDWPVDAPGFSALS